LKDVIHILRLSPTAVHALILFPNSFRLAYIAFVVISILF
jgi:hypothetical protein